MIKFFPELDIFDPKQTLKNPSATHDMAILSIGQKKVATTKGRRSKYLAFFTIFIRSTPIHAYWRLPFKSPPPLPLKNPYKGAARAMSNTNPFGKERKEREQQQP